MSLRTQAILSGGLIGGGYPLLGAGDVRLAVNRGDGVTGTLIESAPPIAAGIQVSPSIMRLLIDRCDLETVTRSTDSAGGAPESWAVKTSSVPCRIETPSAAERTTNDRQEFVYTHRFYVPPGLTADIGTDRIKYDGRAFEIVSIEPVRGGAGIVYKRILAKELR